MVRRETVVDYDAWNRGYMPPTEHVLIDQLAYRGARVLMATDFGKHGAIWIVTRDLGNLKPAARRALHEMIHDVLDQQLGTGSESAPGPAQCETSSPAREQSDEAPLTTAEQP